MGVEENVGKVFSAPTTCLSLTEYLEMKAFVDWTIKLTMPITAEAEKKTKQDIHKYPVPCSDILLHQYSKGRCDILTWTTIAEIHSQELHDLESQPETAGSMGEPANKAKSKLNFREKIYSDTIYQMPAIQAAIPLSWLHLPTSMPPCRAVSPRFPG